MRIGHDAHIRCMADHSPSFFAQFNTRQTERPISQSEAFEVFKRMDRRFKEWTGMTLAEFVSGPHGQSQQGEGK